MGFFIFPLEIMTLNCSFVFTIWGKMIISLIKLLVNESFNVDCSIKSGREEYTRARYAYFHISNIYLPRNQHTIAGFINCKRGIMPYGLTTFEAFVVSSEVYRKKVEIIEQKVKCFENRQFVKKMRRKKCISIKITDDNDLSKIVLGYEYEYIIIDDAEVNEKPIVLVFINDDHYISLSLSKFNEYFKST